MEYKAAKMFSKVFQFNIKNALNFFFQVKIENRKELLVTFENNTINLPYDLSQLLSQLRAETSTLYLKLTSPIIFDKIIFFWMEIVFFIQGYIKKRQLYQQ